MTHRRGKDFIGVGVGAVVINAAGEILLLLRKKAPEIGHWTIPGGTVEFGETLEHAIIRELEEEIGVPCEIDCILGITNHILPLEGTHWVAPAFLVHPVSGQPTNREPETHEEMRWFPPSSLPERITLTTAKAVEYLHHRMAEKTT
jgi:8-oxo-dGTP diphosphatase